MINRIRLEFKERPADHKDREVNGLIESDWNLKLSTDTSQTGVSTRINRIRLEFKVEILFWIIDRLSTRINRIRLEFKVRMD